MMTLAWDFQEAEEEGGQARGEGTEKKVVVIGAGVVLVEEMMAVVEGGKGGQEEGGEEEGEDIAMMRWVVGWAAWLTLRWADG